MAKNHVCFAGIDYGAKLAGTTVIAVCDGSSVKLHQSKKNEDADEFLITVIDEYNIKSVFIDAPLSLPMAYSTKSSGSDFFFRQCDKDCNAMSPMFLGGLTARAMKLRSELSDVSFYETYPTQLLKTLDIDLKGLGLKQTYYLLKSHFKDFILLDEIDNKHQLDALCALLSHHRYNNHSAIIFGNAAEGIITV
jgi:uncharacterized protein